MKKINFLSIFKDKKVRYGTFSTLTAIAVVVALLVVNLIAGRFDAQFDLTLDKSFSITEKSKTILQGLTKDITIYGLFPTGSEVKQFTEVLEQYSTFSNHVSVVYKDPNVYPTFVNSYKKSASETIANNSIIVEGNGRFKVIPASELVTYEMDYSSFSQYASEINIEPKVTNAIEYVMSNSTPKIYQLMGHNETELPVSYKTTLSDKVFAFDTLDLLTSPKVPDDCDVLILTQPSVDYTADEAKKISEYLEENGRALVVMSATTTEMKNVNGIISLYGIVFQPMAIAETDSNYAFDLFTFIPHIQNHDITANLRANSAQTLAYAPQNMTIAEVKKSSLTIEPLLTTSSNAYGKINPSANTYLQEDEDAKGPFTLAYAVTDRYYLVDKDYETKLVFSGATSLLDSSVNEAIKGGNAEFVVSCLEWLCDRQETTTNIASRSLLRSSRLTLTEAQARTIKVISVGVIPVAIFAVGIAVVLRRRYR